MERKTFKDKVAMIVTIVAIILIIIIGFTSKQRDELSVVEKWVGNILSPAQRVVTVGANTVGDGLSSIFNFSKIKRENDLLKKEIEVLQQEVIDLRMSRDELEELRGLKFALNYMEYEITDGVTTANVVAKSPGNWFDIFTIDVGENHGIQKDSIVLASNGLIGRVYEVGGNWSKVISIIDNNSSVSFQVLRDRSYQGIVSGSITNELTGYLFDPMVEVVVGDKIITSGLGIYPRGIMIGEVVEVGKSPDQLLKTITVEPVVNFKKMNKVLVIAPRIIGDE
ncbi:rod shape-determining protein MreC [Natronincola ferrireducens]|uniref:Cell shape-determining protein MreC n=1 Tax=Natronincola ferrireducens TaxID=393762 RepID=A0A1G9D2Z0_9FIRM|nr:rod shape-determining protein MreC [Natronincola ferrireducens]SDK58237.1 rod shape-determining protein MreC [Natronincola ferrireducens]